MKVAEGLSDVSEVVSSSGISVEDLSVRLQENLAGTEFVLVSNKERQMISKKEYEAFRLNVDFDGLLLDFTENLPFIQSRDKSCELTIYNAVLLKQLLLKSAINASLAISDIDGYQKESVASANEVTWANYRRKISRINQKLTQIGFPERFIQNVPNERSYKFPEVNYYIITRDGE